MAALVVTPRAEAGPAGDQQGLVAYAQAEKEESARLDSTGKLMMAHGDSLTDPWVFEDFTDGGRVWASVDEVALSDDGTRIAYRVNNSAGYAIQVRDTRTKKLVFSCAADGWVDPDVNLRHPEDLVDISPDGTKILLYGRKDSAADDRTAMGNVGTGSFSEIPGLERPDRAVGFTPDGRSILVDRGNSFENTDRVSLSDGTATTMLGYVDGVERPVTDVSPDGTIVYERWDFENPSQLRAMKVDRSSDTTLLNTHYDSKAHMSPDGTQALFLRATTTGDNGHSYGNMKVMRADRDGSNAKHVFNAVAWDWAASPGAENRAR